MIMWQTLKIRAKRRLDLYSVASYVVQATSDSDIVFRSELLADLNA